MPESVRRHRPDQQREIPPVRIESELSAAGTPPLSLERTLRRSGGMVRHPDQRCGRTCEEAPTVLTRLTAETMGAQQLTALEEKQREAGEPLPASRERWGAQMLAAFASSMTTAQHVASGCFGALAVDHIQQGHGTLPATDAQLTFFLTSYFLGLLVGSLASGSLGHRFGSRNTMLFSLPTCLLAWVTMALAPSVHVMVAGRMLSGFGVSMGLSCNMLFISATSSPKYRGLLSNIPEFVLTISIILTFLAGKFLVWRHCALIIGISMNVLSAGLLGVLPSDPLWLLGQGRLEAARQSLLFYRGPDADTSQLKARAAAEAETDRCAPPASTLEKLRSLRLRENLTPVLLMAAQIVAFVWMGAAVIQNYAVVFIRRVGITMDPFTLAMVMSASRLPMAMISSLLVDRCGRRPLLMVSSLGMIACHMLMAAYFLVPALAASSVLPIVCVFGAMNFFSLGNGPITWVLIGELLPTPLRELCGGWLTSFYAMLTVAQLQSFPALLATLGEAGVFLFWAVVAVVHLAYVLLLLPETSGLSTQQIEQLFVSRPLVDMSRLVARVVRLPIRPLGDELQSPNEV
ncbi:facilitated trehalose transporter Tret1-2 homolog [Pollicipes pollicipes]|uniref:facilitated trehalose transporter Tret1-2 homolog n=1 Tax=Pollicipes pollicipes TaxID=41117 RepID=UPI0018853529|nr:facilitated trehalose transporter Tret1-2 homolog [Pollicipes pollicipes]